MMFMFSATAFASDFSGNAESELSNISDKIVTAVNVYTVIKTYPLQQRT